MAVRYGDTFKNLISTEVTWGVELHDSAGTPVGGFDIAGTEGVIITQEGPNREPEPGIYTTQATVNLLVADAQVEFYLEDLLEKPRDRFHMVITRNGLFFWAGRFATQNIVFTDASYPYVSTIVAHDGLASLKNIDYSNNGTRYTGDDTVFNIIQKIMEKIDTLDYYSGIFLSYVANWVNNEMDAATVDTANPLTLMRLDQGIFAEKDGDFKNCFDVLELIVKACGFHMTHAGAHFQLFQLNQVADPPYRRFYYNSAFSLMSTDNNVDINRTISTDYSNFKAPHGGGNVWTVVEALKEVDTILEVGAGNLAEDLEWRNGDEGYKDVGVMLIEDGIKWSVRVDIYFSSVTTILAAFTNANETTPHRYYWKVYVRFIPQDGGDTKILSHLFQTASPNYFLAPEAFTSYLQFFTINGDVHRIDASHPGIWQWEDLVGGGIEAVGEHSVSYARATAFPATETVGEVVYDIDMKVVLDKIIDANQVDIQIPLAADYDFAWAATNVGLYFFKKQGDEETPYTGGSEVIRTHNKATNPADAETRIVYPIAFGDVPNAKNGIKIWDGTNWKYSNGEWRFTDEVVLVARKFAIMHSLSIIQTRLINKRRFEGDFIDHEAAFDARYLYQNLYYYPMGRNSIRSGSDIIAGSWFHLSNSDLSNVSEDVIEVANPPVLGPLPPHNPNDLPTGYVPNPSDLVTDEPIDDSVAITTLDIVNTVGAEIGAGEWVQITNMTTNAFLTVQLTAAITGASTSMSFVSVTPTDDFPVGMPIIITTASNFDTLFEDVTADATDVSNAYITVTGPLWDDGSISAAQYNTKVKVHRGGGVNKCKYSASPTASNEFGVTAASQRITFPSGVFGLQLGEEILVEYLIPTFG